MNTHKLATTTKIATLATFLLLTAGTASAEGYSSNDKIRADKIREVPDRPYPDHPYPDRHLEVEIWTNRGDNARYHAGERIEVYFRTNIDAFVAIYNKDTRGRTHRLFPSRHAPNNFVRGGEIHRVPARYGFHFEVEGPTGWETLKAVASTDRHALFNNPDPRYRPTRAPVYSKEVPTYDKIREVPDYPPAPYVAVDITRHYVKDRYYRRAPRRPWWN